MRTITLPNEDLLPEVVKMLSEGNRISIKTKGNSMQPFIEGGKDSVILQKKEQLAVGDIVLAEIAPKKFVVHRIIKIEEEKIILMGDGNLSGAEICGIENIHGHAIAIIHKEKQIDCNSKSEQCKAYLWLKFSPIRRYLLAIYRRIK